MKNVLKIFGIIVMAAVIVFPMVSCGDDGVVSISMLTLKGLGNYNGKYIAAYGANEDESIELVAAANVNANDQIITGTMINGGEVVLTVWKVGGTDDNPTFTRYGGSDKITFIVSISNNQTMNNDSDDNEGGWAIVTFQKGVGVGLFSDIDINNPGGGQNNGTSVNITVPSALAGTWKGDAANGTLIFTTNSISTTDLPATKAYVCIAAIKKVNIGTNAVTISGNGSNGTITYTAGGLVAVSLYTWEINGTTLTITDAVKNTNAFTGTKQ
jgi:hypothetical protein